MNKALISLMCVGLLTACATDDERVIKDDRAGGGAGVVVQPPPQVTTAPPPSSQTTPLTTSRPGVDPLRDPTNILSKRSVYFAYDSYTVEEQYRPMVEAHAKYLSGKSNANVLIQGNTDERGSREYNLALGQKRAEAVKRMLSASGVAERQIEAVSLGEEKPKATGSDESAWAQNRRADINYQGE